MTRARFEKETCEDSWWIEFWRLHLECFWTIFYDNFLDILWVYQTASLLTGMPAAARAVVGPRSGPMTQNFRWEIPRFSGPMTTSNDGVLQICVEITATATREERVSDHKTGRAAAAATWQRALWCERWAKISREFAKAPIAIKRNIILWSSL